MIEVKLVITTQGEEIREEYIRGDFVFYYSSFLQINNKRNSSSAPPVLTFESTNNTDEATLIQIFQTLQKIKAENDISKIEVFIQIINENNPDISSPMDPVLLNIFGDQVSEIIFRKTVNSSKVLVSTLTLEFEV